MENKKMYTKIINSITSNTDNFSWKEFNCLLRPWAIAFKSFNDNYYDSFILLVCFLITHTKKNDIQPYSFIELYDIYLKNYFGININKVTFEDNHDMIEKIKFSIENGYPVLVSGDLFELSYNPMYKIEHYSHLFIIKGYDLKRKIFYILDNIHIDCGASTIYTDFTMTFDELYSLVKSNGRYYTKNNEMFLYNLQQKFTQESSAYDSLLFLKKILQDIESKKLEEWFWNEQIIYNLKNPDVINEIIYTINSKKSYTVTLFKMLSKFKDIDIDKLMILNNDIEKKWDNIKIKVLYKIRKGDYNNLDIITEVNENLKLERNYRKELINNLNKLSSLNNELPFSPYYVMNNKNAKIINDNSGQVTIIHNSCNIYDTWINKDDAVQLLLPKTNDNFFYSVCLNNNFLSGDCFHNGIIIKLKNGGKYMFGNHKNENLTIFAPDLIDKFELYSNYNISFNSLFIKVVSKNNEIQFYYKELEDSDYILIHKEITQIPVEYIGLFSKTWEKINGKSYFDCIKFLNN